MNKPSFFHTVYVALINGKAYLLHKNISRTVYRISSSIGLKRYMRMREKQSARWRSRVCATRTAGLLSDAEHTVKNIYELVKKVIQYKDSTVKNNEKKWINMFM